MSLTSASYPANSAIAVVWQCFVDCQGKQAPDVVIRDARGGSVEAALEKVVPWVGGSLHIYRPAQPLAVGARYEVSAPAEASSAPHFLAFDVTTAASVAAPIQGVRVTLELHAIGLEPTACCPESRSSCGPPFCFLTRERAVPHLSLIAPAPPMVNGREVAQPFIYRAFRVEPDSQEAITTGTPSWLLFGVAFEEARSRYCLRVEAESLVDGSVFRPEPFCQDHRDLGPLGERAAAITDLLETPACLLPPAELTAEWCAVNRARCKDPASDDCQHYPRLCGTSQGCVYSTVASPAPPPWLLLAWIAALLLRRRKTK